MISAVAHALALTGRMLFTGVAMMVTLHAGAILLGFATAIFARRASRDEPLRRRVQYVLSAGGPGWLGALISLLFVYALVNFFWVMTSGALPHGHTGQNQLSAPGIRLFSGHWMLFYGLEFAVFLSLLRKPDLLD